MTMNRLFGLTLLASSALAFAAAAAPHPQHVRGTVVSVSSGSMVVHPMAGSDITVALTSNTKYATVMRADLSKIEQGSYVGAATKGSGTPLVALEVVIFPPSMRGAGAGHYPWDKMPDTATPGGTTASTMTNGNVDSSAPAGNQVASTMTNGNVDATTGQSGGRQLVVSYKGGKQTIMVPPTAPVVTLQPAVMSAVQTGATVFVAGSEDAGKVTAGFVAVGTPGANPPM